MLELLRTRRSRRKFKPEELPREVVDDLIKAVLLSPSSRNTRPWEFIFVDDTELLQQLASAKEHGSKLIEGAPLAVVVLADPHKCDVWVEDTSIASVILQLQAEDMGLGSCWVQIRERMHDSATTSEDYVKELLGIPAKFEVESIVAIGYPDEVKEPYQLEELPYGKIHSNSYGTPRE